jgi:NAD(P)-dependent dehydrogenase (short-subunit alcohol dehydrogenase family)
MPAPTDGQLRFDDRVVLVTGGGQGLGRCHALLLAARGAKVVIGDYGVSLGGDGSSSKPADAVVEEIRAAGGAAAACFASVNEPEGAAAMVQTAIDAFGKLDAVVNNAGIVRNTWMEDLTDDEFRALFDNHTRGTFLVTKAAWPHLVASDAGRVVNTISESMLGQVPKSISYATAKGGLFGFTRSLALDGMRHGVRVNAIAPRGITRAHDPAVLSAVMDRPPEDFQAEFFSAMKPELVSPAVVYLAHESCTLDGRVLVAGAGQVKELVVVETQGIYEADLTLEHVAAGIDTIIDREGAEPMDVGIPLA